MGYDFVWFFGILSAQETEFSDLFEFVGSFAFAKLKFSNESAHPGTLLCDSQYMLSKKETTDENLIQIESLKSLVRWLLKFEFYRGEQRKQSCYEKN